MNENPLVFKLTVPVGLEECLEGISRAVLQNGVTETEDILALSAKFFKSVKEKSAALSDEEKLAYLRKRAKGRPKRTQAKILKNENKTENSKYKEITPRYLNKKSSDDYRTVVGNTKIKPLVQDKNALLRKDKKQDHLTNKTPASNKKKKKMGAVATAGAGGILATSSVAGITSQFSESKSEATEESHDISGTELLSETEPISAQSQSENQQQETDLASQEEVETNGMKTEDEFDAPDIPHDGTATSKADDASKTTVEEVYNESINEGNLKDVNVLDDAEKKLSQLTKNSIDSDKEKYESPAVESKNETEEFEDKNVNEEMENKLETSQVISSDAKQVHADLDQESIEIDQKELEKKNEYAKHNTEEQTLQKENEIKNGKPDDCCNNEKENDDKNESKDDISTNGRNTLNEPESKVSLVNKNEDNLHPDKVKTELNNLNNEERNDSMNSKEDQEYSTNESVVFASANDVEHDTEKDSSTSDTNENVTQIDDDKTDEISESVEQNNDKSDSKSSEIIPPNLTQVTKKHQARGITHILDDYDNKWTNKYGNTTKNVIETDEEDLIGEKMDVIKLEEGTDDYGIDKRLNELMKKDIEDENPMGKIEIREEKVNQYGFPQKSASNYTNEGVHDTHSDVQKNLNETVESNELVKSIDSQKLSDEQLEYKSADAKILNKSDSSSKVNIRRESIDNYERDSSNIDAYKVKNKEDQIDEAISQTLLGDEKITDGGKKNIDFNGATEFASQISRTVPMLRKLSMDDYEGPVNKETASGFVKLIEEDTEDLKPIVKKESASKLSDEQTGKITDSLKESHKDDSLSHSRNDSSNNVSKLDANINESEDELNEGNGNYISINSGSKKETFVEADEHKVNNEEVKNVSSELIEKASKQEHLESKNSLDNNPGSAKEAPKVIPAKHSSENESIINTEPTAGTLTSTEVIHEQFQSKSEVMDMKVENTNEVTEKFEKEFSKSEVETANDSEKIYKFDDAEVIKGESDSKKEVLEVNSQKLTEVSEDFENEVSTNEIEASKSIVSGTENKIYEEGNNSEYTEKEERNELDNDQKFDKNNSEINTDIFKAPESVQTNNTLSKGNDTTEKPEEINVEGHNDKTELKDDQINELISKELLKSSTDDIGPSDDASKQSSNQDLTEGNSVNMREDAHTVDNDQSMLLQTDVSSLKNNVTSEASKVTDDLAQSTVENSSSFTEMKNQVKSDVEDIHKSVSEEINSNLESLSVQQSKAQESLSEAKALATDGYNDMKESANELGSQITDKTNDVSKAGYQTADDIRTEVTEIFSQSKDEKSKLENAISATTSVANNSINEKLNFVEAKTENLQSNIESQISATTDSVKEKVNDLSVITNDIENKVESKVQETQKYVSDLTNSADQFAKSSIEDKSTELHELKSEFSGDMKDETSKFNNILESEAKHVEAVDVTDLYDISMQHPNVTKSSGKSANDNEEEIAAELVKMANDEKLASHLEEQHSKDKPSNIYPSLKQAHQKHSSKDHFDGRLDLHEKGNDETSKSSKNNEIENVEADLNEAIALSKNKVSNEVGANNYSSYNTSTFVPKPQTANLEDLFVKLNEQAFKLESFYLPNEVVNSVEVCVPRKVMVCTPGTMRSKEKIGNYPQRENTDETARAQRFELQNPIIFINDKDIAKCLNRSTASQLSGKTIDNCKLPTGSTNLCDDISSFNESNTVTYYMYEKKSTCQGNVSSSLDRKNEVFDENKIGHVTLENSGNLSSTSQNLDLLESHDKSLSCSGIDKAHKNNTNGNNHGKEKYDSIEKKCSTNENQISSKFSTHDEKNDFIKFCSDAENNELNLNSSDYKTINKSSGQSENKLSEHTCLTLDITTCPELSKEELAAIKIQSHFRGFLARKQMRDNEITQQLLSEMKDSSYIQEASSQEPTDSAYIHPCSNLSKLDEIKQDNNLDLEKAAVVIQAIYRGFIVRRRLKREMEDAALKIQASFRKQHRKK